MRYVATETACRCVLRNATHLSVAGGIVHTMLSVKEKMTLDYEARWWKYAGGKEATIRETFGESATRFYQRLNHLIDQPEALAYSPMTVRRLQRMREERRSVRSRSHVS